MAKPFDVALKHLVEAHPLDCLRLLGIREPRKVRVSDADLSTVISEADKVIQVEDAEPWLVHLEFQSSYDKILGEHMLLYNVVLQWRHQMPVLSAVLLLRKQADGSALTGVVRRDAPGSRLDFRFQIVRLWQLAVEDVWQGGVGALPLISLCDITLEALPATVRRMDERLTSEVDEGERATLWTAAYVLLGLRFSRETANQLLRGVRAMKESVTYQAIVEEGLVRGRAEGKAEGMAVGKAEEARRLLLRWGRQHLGRPDPETVRVVEAIVDLARLEDLGDRVARASSWQELLAIPAPRARNGRRKRKS